MTPLEEGEFLETLRTQILRRKLTPRRSRYYQALAAETYNKGWEGGRKLNREVLEPPTLVELLPTS